jgi:hypothetical protein
VLCPSFYRADIIHNPTWFDRFVSGLRRAVIGFLQRRRDARRDRLRGLTRNERHHERPIGDADADAVHDRTADLHRRHGHGRPGRRRARRLDRGARRAQGWHAQSTSVPGVAQRTGATIYYVEMLPPKGGRAPILSLMPAQGEVDVVLASELMEAGRSILRGLVTPDRTTLIASTHRLYSRSPRRKSRATPPPIRPCRRRGRRRGQAHHRFRHGGAGEQEQQPHLRLPVRNARRIRHFAVRPRGLRGHHQSRRRGIEPSLNAFAPRTTRRAAGGAAPALARPAKRFAPLPASAGRPTSTSFWRASANFPSRCTAFCSPASSASPISRIRPMRRISRSRRQDLRA